HRRRRSVLSSGTIGSGRGKKITPISSNNVERSNPMCGRTEYHCTGSAAGEIAVKIAETTNGHAMSKSIAQTISRHPNENRESHRGGASTSSLVRRRLRIASKPHSGQG